MFENDYIMRQIEGLTRFLAKVLMQKDMGSADVIDEQGHLDPGNFLLYRLQGMVGQGAEEKDLLRGLGGGHRPEQVPRHGHLPHRRGDPLHRCGPSFP